MLFFKGTDYSDDSDYNEGKEDKTNKKKKKKKNGKLRRKDDTMEDIRMTLLKKVFKIENIFY